LVFLLDERPDDVLGGAGRHVVAVLGFESRREEELELEHPTRRLDALGAARSKSMSLSKNSRCSRMMQFITLIMVRRRCSMVWISQRAELSLPWMYSRVVASPSVHC